jgi:hypothetical protein
MDYLVAPSTLVLTQPFADPYTLNPWGAWYGDAPPDSSTDTYPQVIEWHARVANYILNAGWKNRCRVAASGYVGRGTETSDGGVRLSASGAAEVWVRHTFFGTWERIAPHFGGLYGAGATSHPAIVVVRPVA